jgi:phage/plasmid-like protein (TIGR03299 family)
MAANIDTTTGNNAVAYFGETPWHGLGQVIPEQDRFDAAACSKTSFTDFAVGLRELYTPDGLLVPNKAVVREDTGGFLSVVGPNWTPLQNEKLFDWFQPWLDAQLASIECCGALGNGERVWCLAKVIGDPIDIVAGGDPVQQYILLSNKHGIGAAYAGFTPIRVVCQNTLEQAQHSADSKLIRVYHSAKIEQNVEKLRGVMNVARAEFEATAAQYKDLASRQFNSTDLQKYIRVCLGMEEDGVLPKRSQTRLQEIISLCISGKGQDIDGVRGTWWGAYNGVNEYLNYDVGRQADTRLDSLWFGRGKKMNELAFRKAVEFATGV